MSSIDIDQLLVLQLIFVVLVQELEKSASRKQTCVMVSGNDNFHFIVWIDFYFNISNRDCDDGSDEDSKYCGKIFITYSCSLNVKRLSKI